MSTKTSLTLGNLIMWTPLAAMPAMLCLRSLRLVAPNEDLKWCVLVLVGLVVAVATLYRKQLICRKKETTESSKGLSVAGAMFCLFLAWLAIGLAYTVNQGAGLNRFVYWCASGVTLAASAWGARHYSRYLGDFRLVISLSSLLLSSLFWYGFLVDFRDPTYPQKVMFSPIGHFNFTADVLVMLIPLLAWTALTVESLALRAAALLSLGSTCFMLMVSGSLGGMGGIAGGLVVTCMLWASRRMLQPSSSTDRASIHLSALSRAFIALIVLAAAAKPAWELIPQHFRKEMFVRGVWWGAPGQADFKKAQNLPPLEPLWENLLPIVGSRTPMWAATTGMISSRPLLGFGTGSFLYEYPGYSKRFDVWRDFETLGINLKTNPHNILLQLGAENGLPAILLFSGLYLYLMLRVVGAAWRTPSALWFCATWAVVATWLDAQVNHVFFNPASMYVAAIGLGLFWGRLPPLQANVALPNCKFWLHWATPALISATVIWLASFPWRFAVSEYYVMEARRLESAQPSVTPRRIFATWEKAATWSPSNVEALYGLVQLYQSSGQLDYAETGIRAFLRLAPNHSPALNLLASMQIQSGRLDEAEESLKKALRLEPDAKALHDNLIQIQKQKGEKSPPLPPAATP